MPTKAPNNDSRARSAKGGRSARPSVKPADINPRVLAILGIFYNIQNDLFDAQRTLWEDDGLTLRSATIVILIFNKIDRPLQLKEYFNILSSTVSFEINKLVKKGLVIREQVPGDARTVRFVLTAEGLHRHEQMLKIVNKFMVDRLKILNEGEFEKFLEIGWKLARFNKEKTHSLATLVGLSKPTPKSK